MFHALLIALSAGIGLNCLVNAWDDWINRCATHYVVRAAGIGVLGVAAAVAGLVEVIV